MHRFPSCQIETFCGWTYVFPTRSHSAPELSTLALNETGTLIFKLIQDHLNEQEIAHVLSEEYGVSPEQSLAAVIQFQQQLKSLQHDS